MIREIFTQEVITAIVGLIGLILVGQFPGLKDQITAIQAAIVAIIITLIGAQTANRASIRAEATKVQIAQAQALAAEGRAPKSERGGYVDVK